MKKIAKICILILIILMTLGLAISNVSEAYCVQGQVMNFGGDANMHDVSSREVPGPYAGGLPENFDNDYAKDYIMSAEGYTEEEQQEALYALLGDEYGLTDGIGDGSGQELYIKAIEYQNKKLSEIETLIKLTKGEDAITSFNGDNLIYGPIYVDYPYGEVEERRTWGGFYYAFFDEAGNNVSNNVKLCTLENGEYKEISSTLSTSEETNGYNKVTSGEYSKAKLYLVVSDRYLTKVKMKVCSFQIVKRARIIRSEGTATVPGGTWYCASCKQMVLKPVTQTKESAFQPNQNAKKVSFVRTEKTQVGWQTCSGGYSYIGGGVYRCKGCGRYGSTASHSRPKYKYVSIYLWTWTETKMQQNNPNGCGKVCHSEKGHSYRCGQHYAGGTYKSQAQERVEEIEEKEEIINWAELEIELGTTIEVEKNWEDYENSYGIRPENIEFNVYRSIDKQNWEELKADVDYKVIIKEKNETNWKVLITGLLKLDAQGRAYYFKVEEKPLNYYEPTYLNGNYPEFGDNPAYGHITIDNKIKKVGLGGYVWLDGQTGIKPAIPNNGIMDDGETRMKDIVVYLYYKDPKTGTISQVAETVTDENGHYEFKDYEIGLYYTEFYYDGIHYEDTIKIENGSAKAFEDVANGQNNSDRRSTFNNRFTTITYKKSNDGTVLNYNYIDKKSILITNEDQKTTIKKEFQMTAETPIELINLNTDNLNLGLITRGTDLAISTDVYDAKVKINGQTTDYKFNTKDNSIEIGTTETNEEVTYNLNLYKSDYNYRIRDYANTQGFQEKDYINGENPEGLTTGSDLNVYVIYELNLQNQSSKTTKVNEVKYKYDEKYNFVGLQNSSYDVQDSENVLTLNLNGLELKEGETKTLYLVFEVSKTNNNINLGEYLNKAEITSYSNDEGLIDCDSQPGNFMNDNEVEDDSDTAGGLKILLPSDLERKITGNVFDKAGNKVNDVIVQLIELKSYNGKEYEYIWQETVSGTEKGQRLNAEGTALEEYSYSKADGYYEFRGMIAGNYIVRFIYGDGTTYDMTGNVIKYNGQDYKSMPDANYKAEWYNNSSYTEGASVARDNEARRLETMSYGVEVDATKGVLLKLLNNVTPETLNKTEKEILISAYKTIYGENITDITQDIINKLLKEQVLKNTWMCAETSKIKVTVDTEDQTNTSVTTEVNGITTTYKNSITNINFGLELRPETKIELKKYVTGFKLVASNGQTLVNAYIDVNQYLDPDVTDISGKVEGLKDHVTILNTVWQYEVAPTDINTVVEGANLEFEYTLVVRNTGEDDYLSEELANMYNTGSIADYKALLASKASEVKGTIREGTYRTQIGNSLGNSYYAGGTGAGKVLTEVLDIRDYINNDLTFTTSGKVAIDEDAPKTHRILRDDYSMQTIDLKTILKTTESTGKMNNSGETKDAVMYKVILGKNPISSTGNLNFENYIAEVMKYTNAAGRRAMTSTPGNAEIVDAERREGRTHEIDEADTGRIQIGAATGDEQTINYIIIIGVAVGIVVVAIGAYVIKKYIIK